MVIQLIFCLVQRTRMTERALYASMFPMYVYVSHGGYLSLFILRSYIKLFQMFIYWCVAGERYFTSYCWCIYTARLIHYNGWRTFWRQFAWFWLQRSCYSLLYTYTCISTIFGWCMTWLKIHEALFVVNFNWVCRLAWFLKYRLFI